ncbi:hypothetical protein [Bradyrhizobium sp. ORS 111]|uniref:hypothetical protein n=1 Tax=Bradyrhizobium sp. ORS 111 TaxID=1685958 RepID=UPI00388D99BE
MPAIGPPLRPGDHEASDSGSGAPHHGALQRVEDERHDLASGDFVEIGDFVILEGAVS